MAHMTAAARSVSQIIGRSENPVNGDNDRPYGKCYGQVNGVSYPCTQKSPEQESNKAPSKQDYQQAKHVPKRSKRVRCLEIGAMFASIVDAAKFAGVPKSTFMYALRNERKAQIGGYTFEVID